MEDEKIQDVKYTCDNCGYENYVAGYCDMCEKGYMKKVCECDSGKYAFECCEPDIEEKEKEMRQKVESDFESEATKELKAIEDQEDTEQKEKERLLEEGEKESQKLD